MNNQNKELNKPYNNIESDSLLGKEEDLESGQESKANEETPHVPFGDDMSIVRANEHTPVPTEGSVEDATTAQKQLETSESSLGEQPAEEDLIEKMVTHENVQQANAFETLQKILAVTQKPVDK